MELDELCEALGLEKEEFIEFASLFVDVALRDLSSMRDALKRDDMRSFADAAHSLKGAASTLDMEEIFMLARALEAKAKRGEKLGMEQELKVLEGHLLALQDALVEGKRNGMATGGFRELHLRPGREG